MTVLLMVLAVAIASPSRVSAQTGEPPTNAPVQIGPLVLAPAIRLTNLGYDSNVFNRNADSFPQGDFVIAVTPLIDGWLRLPHARVLARSQFDMYYFKELTDLRAVDTDNAARLELPINRLMPYVDGAITNTRHRQNLEIDAIAKRRNASVTVGTDFRVTDKVVLGGYARREELTYDPTAVYLGTDLARALDHTSAGEGLAMRYAWTPFTTATVEVERQRDRFDLSPERDNDTVRVVPSLTFSPFALISGRAAIGYQWREFNAGGQPDFSGVLAFIDLNYTLLARTHITFGARRQLEYSYLAGQYQYVDGGVTVSVTHRLGDAWDIGGSISRSRLTYQRPITPTPGTSQLPDETIQTGGIDIGYNLGRRARIGFFVEHREREPYLSPQYRAYQRLRLGSTITYVF